MSRYMLLLYATAPDDEEQAEREEELPLYFELQQSLDEAGLLVAVQPLRHVDTATSVRVRNGETELTDGPFATTKEVLVGYYIVDCPDLDAALKTAAQVPMAKYGTIEVRPVQPLDEWVARAREVGADLPEVIPYLQ